MANRKSHATKRRLTPGPSCNTRLYVVIVSEYCSRQQQEFQDFRFWRQICSSKIIRKPYDFVRLNKKNKNERDICQLAYAKSFAKTTGTNSPDGHATIQPKWRNIKKSRWTVRQQWLVVTRPSADCRTTFFRRFKQFGKILKKSCWTVTRQWSEVTRPLDDCQTTFLDVSSNSENFWKKSLKVTRQWSEVTRPLDDCQTTFFRRFKQFGKILKKVTEGHATVVGGHATVGWLSNNVFLTFQAIRKNFEKSHWRSRDSGRRSRDRWMTVKQRFLTFQAFGNFLKKVTERSRDSGRRSRDRRPTVKQRFLDVSSNSKIFWKKSLNGHATVVGGHATVGRLSNNVFWTFQAIWNFFEKSHWTVTRQWSEVTRPSADCQTTFFGRFKQFEIFLKKVTERSRDSGRRSRDRRLTVKHIYAWIREREREREDYLRYTSYGHRHVVPLAVSSAGVPVEASSLTRVVDRQGQLVYEYCKSSHWQVEFMLCAICQEYLYPTILPCVDPRPKLSRFFTGISRKRYVVLRRLCL